MKQEYEALKKLKEEFVLACDKAKAAAGGRLDHLPTHVLHALWRQMLTLDEARTALKEKFVTLKWARFDRRLLPRVERKTGYAVMETLKGHTNSVWTLQVLPDGRIVSGSSDNTIRIWEKKDNRWESVALEGHTDSVWTLQVLPDGRIVSGSHDNTIRIWDGKKESW